MKKKKQSFEDGAQHRLAFTQLLALPPVWMSQVIGTSLMAAQAVVRVALSPGTKAKSLCAQA